MPDNPNQDVRRWPIDFDALQKGSFIPVEDLERAFRANRDTRVFNFKVMGLISDIRDFFKDRREQTVTVCQKDGGITVLTDEQAVSYNAAKFSEHFRKAGQAHKRTLGIDTEQLSDDGKRRHERGVILQAAMLSAAMNAKNQVLRLQPHQRNIPQMKPPENGGGK
jgi:ethanolamine utilization protein EutA (predicted chaperonin)